MVRMIGDGTLPVLSKEDFKEPISEPMVQEVEIPLAKALAEQGRYCLGVRYEEDWGGWPHRRCHTAAADRYT